MSMISFGKCSALIFGFCLLLSVILLVSCGDDIFSDSIWVQSKTVNINNSKFPDCVKKSLIDLEYLSINQKESNKVNIALNFNLGIKNLSLNIQLRKNHAVEIIFSGPKYIGNDEIVKTIDPILESIATAIEKGCN